MIPIAITKKQQAHFRKNFRKPRTQARLKRLWRLHYATHCWLESFRLPEQG